MRTYFAMISSLLLFTVSNTSLAKFGEFKEKTGLRNQRFCEILLIKSVQPSFSSHILSVNTEIYNTVGYNSCPEAWWNNLTTDRVRDITGAQRIIFNGPRKWAFDSVKGSKMEEAIEIDGTKLGKVADIDLDLWDVIYGKVPYKIRNVERRTVWTFNAGREVYELVDPNQGVWVMQSYDGNLEEEAMVAKVRTLPEGWSFRKRVLRKPLNVVAVNDKAQIIRDEFDSTYQYHGPKSIVDELDSEQNFGLNTWESEF